MKFADPKNDIAFKKILTLQKGAFIILQNQIYNWNKEELEVYDYVAMQEGKRKSELDSARDEGMAEGIKQAKIEIVRNLLDILDDETISKKTGLSTETIKNLRN